MRREEFCNRVLSRVRWATAEEKAAIRAELWGHMEDHMADLTENGWPAAEAEERAVETMGDPEEIGAGLDSRYPLVWLVLSRLAAVAILLVCVRMVMGLPFARFHHAWGNLGARFDPTDTGFAPVLREGETFTELDIRVEVDSDILYIYGVSVIEGGEGTMASLHLCNYDKNPFGYASSSLLDRVEVGAAVETYWSSAGGGGNVGAYFRVFRDIPVGERESLYVTYNSFGEDIFIEVPLEGRGAA